MLPAPLLTLHEEVFRIPDRLFVPPEELGCCSIVQKEPGLSSDAVEVLQPLRSVLVLPPYPFQLPLDINAVQNRILDAVLFLPCVVLPHEAAPRAGASLPFFTLAGRPHCAVRERL